MLNSTTKTNATTVAVAINAAINAVNVQVRGVAHSLLERLDYWLFGSDPDYYGISHQSMRQACGLLKRRFDCCPVVSRSSGTGNFQTNAEMTRSFENV